MKHFTICGWMFFMPLRLFLQFKNEITITTACPRHWLLIWSWDFKVFFCPILWLQVLVLVWAMDPQVLTSYCHVCSEVERQLMLVWMDGIIEDFINYCFLLRWMLLWLGASDLQVKFGWLHFVLDGSSYFVISWFLNGFLTLVTDHHMKCYMKSSS